MKRLLILAVFTLSLAELYALPTRVIVRARAKDAKFIGTSMGGAWVRIRDVQSQEILAQGSTVGSTGNTSLLMKEAHERYTQISSEGSAKFEVVLDLDEPIFVDIEVIAPYQKKQARASVRTQVWLIPGKDMAGDGIIMEIPGFVIDALSPQTHSSVKLANGQQEIPIKANIVMMCGCTISKGGLWDGDQMEVKALVKRNGKAFKTVDLTLGEQVNTFLGTLVVDQVGSYEIVVYAYDPKTANTGIDKTFVNVRN
ncbi:MAG: hypothetical protein AAFU64_18520 [Bacteroidota bacterium]